jgi:hypothetical protein
MDEFNFQLGLRFIQLELQLYCLSQVEAFELDIVLYYFEKRIVVIIQLDFIMEAMNRLLQLLATRQ